LHILALLILLSGCLCVMPPSGEEATTTTLEEVKGGFPQDRASCERAGGRWGVVGLAPRESCNLPTSDGGKACNDAGDCEGTCVAKLTQSQMDAVKKGTAFKASGKCTGWRINVGCQAIVHGGNVKGLICVD